MHSQLIVSGMVAFASLTSAAPATTRDTSCAKQSFNVNYNFETVERGDPIIVSSEIKEYNLLYFTWNLAETDPDHDGNHLGSAPHTYPNAAVFSGNTMLASGKPTITTNYTESTITEFDALSWYYGCVLPSTESAGSLPTNCTITATGLNAAGATIASQEFSFAKNGSVVQNMNYAAFKGFAGVSEIVFDVTNPSTTAAIVDNFIATLYQPSCAPLDQPGISYP